ncbi:uncharacterized protein PAC_01192 [Phialocephala subalpina]|uniref:Uncharacterized protein n=1 Tax=Phialocephala subalpina TaxID=576137 RepID=A0A1L7WEV7_9HELO|nr:uncharacterized protein PAC_01192 [Phialocephala subalpina]
MFLHELLTTSQSNCNSQNIPMASERPNFRHVASAEQTDEKIIRQALEQPASPQTTSNASIESTFHYRKREQQQRKLITDEDDGWVWHRPHHRAYGLPEFEVRNQEVETTPERVSPKKIPGTWGLESDKQIPGILLACREAFEVCNRSCSRSFANKGALAQTYFNFELDSLILSEESAVSLYYPDSRCAADRLIKLIKHLGTGGQLHSVRYLGLSLANRATWDLIGYRLEGNGKPWRSKRMADVLFRPANSVEQAFEIYNNPNLDLLEYNRFSSPSKQRVSGIEETRLEKHRKEQVALGRPSWKLPTIETRHLVKKDIKWKLAAAEKELRRKLNAQNMVPKAWAYQQAGQPLLAGLEMGSTY